MVIAEMSTKQISGIAFIYSTLCWLIKHINSEVCYIQWELIPKTESLYERLFYSFVILEETYYWGIYWLYYLFVMR